MKVNEEEIKYIIESGIGKNYTHVIICFNNETHKIFSRYIKKGESIEQVIFELENLKEYSLSIIDIFNYNIVLTKNTQSEKTHESAIEFARRKHQNQYRKDGTEYINHPIRVAENVLKYKKSNNMEALVSSAYLHDTLEDTDTTYYDLVETFGPQVASIVLELTTDKDLKNELGKAKYLKIKMKNMSSWALVIKLCDRLDNVSDLKNTSERFQEKYIAETLEIIEYLKANRDLSKTHLRIIEDILKEIEKLRNPESLNELNRVLRPENT